MSRGNRGRNNKKRVDNLEKIEQDSISIATTITATVESKKDEHIKEQTHLNQVKQNMKRTGKSKEYLNKLSKQGCPKGRKHPCCSLKTSKKSLNQRRNSGQNKGLNAVKMNACDIDEVGEKENDNAIEHFFVCHKNPPVHILDDELNDELNISVASEHNKSNESNDINESKDINESNESKDINESGESEEFEVIKINN